MKMIDTKNKLRPSGLLVILDFSSLSDTNLQILTPKR